MTEPILAVEGLRTHFPTRQGVVRAVEDVSFSVAPGKILGLVGESGSGKSVTGYSIMGLVDPPGRIVAGRILMRGRDLRTLPAEEMRKIRGNRIAMIFQDPMMTLNPVLRIDTQMIEAILAHQKVDRRAARDRSRVALAQVGIPSPDERLHAYPHQFSGGMRQRVAIAIALLNRPELIIADEPTTALDVTIQAQILELMKELTRRLGVALIIITHNLGVVARYANRVNVMYAGRIVESGSAEALYRSPRHPYTMALLRSVPRLDIPRRTRLDPVDGQPPDLMRLDGGCAFRPRCRFAVDACATAQPPLAAASEAEHRAACFRLSEIGAGSGLAA
jgi:oligopeptide/dipeptide ABC transporter ATP-binding protein